VGGDAVAYTEPDAPAIAAALRDLLTQPSRRQALGEAGQARSQEFSWAASASAHMASYKKAAEDSSGGAAASLPAVKSYCGLNRAVTLPVCRCRAPCMSMLRESPAGPHFGNPWQQLTVAVSSVTFDVNSWGETTYGA
jgi:hypothetical protein